MLAPMAAAGLSRGDRAAGLTLNASIRQTVVMLEPLVIEDHRQPGAVMPQVQFRLPAEALERLQRQADLLKCSRSGLTRALALRGLAELEQASSS